MSVPLDRVQDCSELLTVYERSHSPFVILYTETIGRTCCLGSPPKRTDDRDKYIEEWTHVFPKLDILLSTLLVLSPYVISGSDPKFQDNLIMFNILIQTGILVIARTVVLAFRLVPELQKHLDSSKWINGCISSSLEAVTAARLVLESCKLSALSGSPFVTYCLYTVGRFLFFFSAVNSNSEKYRGIKPSFD